MITSWSACFCRHSSQFWSRYFSSHIHYLGASSPIHTPERSECSRGERSLFCLGIPEGLNLSGISSWGSSNGWLYFVLIPPALDALSPSPSEFIALRWFRWLRTGSGWRWSAWPTDWDWQFLQHYRQWYFHSSFRWLCGRWVWWAADLCLIV